MALLEDLLERLRQTFSPAPTRQAPIGPIRPQPTFPQRAMQTVQNAATNFQMTPAGQAVQRLNKVFRDTSPFNTPEAQAVPVQNRNVKQAIEMSAPKVTQSFNDFFSNAFGDSVPAQVTGRTIGGIGAAAGSALTVPFTKKPVVEKAGDVLRTVGAFAKPGTAIASGGINVPLNAAITRATQGRFPTKEENLDAYSKGIDTGAMIAGVGKFLGPAIEPLMKKIAPTELKNINTYINLFKNGSTEEIRSRALHRVSELLARNVIAAGTEGGVGFGALGLTEPAENTQARLKKGIENFLTGFALSGGSKLAGYGAEAAYGQVVKPAIDQYKQASAAEKQRGAVRLDGGTGASDIGTQMEDAIAKGDFKRITELHAKMAGGTPKPLQAYQAEAYFKKGDWDSARRVINELPDSDYKRTYLQEILKSEKGLQATTTVDPTAELKNLQGKYDQMTDKMKSTKTGEFFRKRIDELKQQQSGTAPAAAVPGTIPEGMPLQQGTQTGEVNLSEIFKRNVNRQTRSMLEAQGYTPKQIDALNQGDAQKIINQIVPAGEKERKFITTVRESPKTAPAVAAEVSGSYAPITNKETLGTAKKLVSKDFNEALRRVTEEPLSAETNAIGQDIMRRAQSGGMHDEAVKMAEALAKKGTDAGQAVQAFSIWSRMTPEGMLKYAQQEITRANQDQPMLNKTVNKILSRPDVKLDAEDSKIITNLMKKANAAKSEEEKAELIKDVFEHIGKKMPWGVSDVVDSYRYNNMLSNPLTHLRNAINNLQQAYVVRPATIAASGKPGDAIKYEIGALKAIPDALDLFKKTMKEGRPLGKLDDKAIAGLRPIKPNRIGKFNLPSQAMEASDQFFQKIVAAGEMARGTSAEKAGQIAEYSMFRQDLNAQGQGHLLNKLDDVTKAVYQLRKVGLGWFIPFIRTPMNVAKQWIEYSPAGIATLPGAADKKEQLAKTMLGSIATMIGAEAALSGRTTWSSPTDPKQKQYFYDSGRKPFSIKIGDKWVPMQTFGVFSLALGLPAAVKYHTEDSRTALTDSDMEKLTKVVAAGMEFWSNQTFVSGLGSFVKLAQGDEDYSFPKNIANVVGQLKPAQGFLRYISQVVDPVFRRPTSMEQQFKEGIPFLTKSLPYYEDSLGRPSKRNITNYTFPYAAGIENPEFEEIYQQRTDQLQQNNVINKMKKEAQEKITQTGDQVFAAEDAAPGVDQQKFVDAQKTKMQEDLAKEKLKLSADPTAKVGDKVFYKDADDAVKTIDVGKVTRMPEATPYDKALKRTAAFKIADEILQLPEEMQPELFTKIGVKPADARYYEISGQNEEARRVYVKQVLQSGGDPMNTLVPLLYSTGGKTILTDAIIGDLYQDGLIDKNQEKLLKSLFWDEDKKIFRTPRGYKASGTGGVGGSAYTKKLLAIHTQAARQLGDILSSPVKTVKLPSNVRSLDSVFQARSPQNNGLRRLESILQQESRNIDQLKSYKGA